MKAQGFQIVHHVLTGGCGAHILVDHPNDSFDIDIKCPSFGIAHAGQYAIAITHFFPWISKNRKGGVVLFREGGVVF